jgi:amino acid transporter
VITVLIVITMIGSLFTLTNIINAALATPVIIQSLAQVAAIVVLRRRQPNLPRPYRQWLYPLPTVVALIGWVYIYISASWLSIGLSVGWILVGAIAFVIYAKAEHTWPFGPKEVKEAFVDGALVIVDSRHTTGRVSLEVPESQNGGGSAAYRARFWARSHSTR